MKNFLLVFVVLLVAVVPLGAELVQMELSIFGMD